MTNSFSSTQRGARKIRVGGQMLHHAHLRQRLLKEISELEARMDALERSQDFKHEATLNNYREMIVERLQILQDIFTDHT